MMDAGEKIGEVADRRRQVQPAIGGAVQQPVGERFGPGRPGRRRRAAQRPAGATRGAAPGRAPSAGSACRPKPPRRRAPPRPRTARHRARRAGRRSCRRSRRRRAGSSSEPPRGLNTPNGRFCSGNSGWPLAEIDPAPARAIMGFVDHAESSRTCRKLPATFSLGDGAACTQDLPAAGGQHRPRQCRRRTPRR